jgi:hypothetical protein
MLSEDPTSAKNAQPAFLMAIESSFKYCTVKSGIFDGFLEVFWIFLKNEHDKPLGTPNRAF